MGQMLIEPPWTMHYRTNFRKEQVSAAPRPGVKHSTVPEGHLDPDELTRRLYMVLAEQKAHAERRQRAHKGGLRPASNTRHRDSTKPAREGRPQPAEPRADLITELRRSESAKTKPVPDAQGTEYHHVPSQAAKQFTRTTTVDNMRDSDLVHKLSKRALKFHLQGSKTGRSTTKSGANDKNSSGATDVAPAELTSALQQTQAQHSKHLERNQFQRTRILDDAARLDHGRQQLQQQQHTFEAELSRLHHPHPRPAKPNTPAGWWQQHALRRNSTGNTLDPVAFDTTAAAATTSPTTAHHHIRRSLIALDPPMDTLLEDSAAAAPLSPTTVAAEEQHVLARFPPAERARADWTQSDELARRGGAKMLLLSPLLRKADSLWALRAGRRGSRDLAVEKEKEKEGDGEKAGEGEGEAVAESPVSPTKAGGKGSFFAKFKR